MAAIEGLRGVNTPAAPRRTARSGADWIAPALTEQAPAVQPSAAMAGLDSLLALQERQGDAAADRRARRHGQHMLASLARLQLGLLAPGGPPAADLQALGALCNDMPFTADTGLRGVLQSIALRARIELARRMTT